MYKAIIVDDEEMARTLLAGMIDLYCPQLEVVAQCKDLPNGVKAIHKFQPDIVFLDIEMPGHSGLELLDFFDESEINFSIVFVTAYNRYAIQAFKLSAIDYLLKPIESDDLQHAIALFEKRQQRLDYAILKNNLGNKLPKKIGISGVSSTLFVDLSDILFLQADGSYTIVYLKDGRAIVASKSLKYFENVLVDCIQFYRCHKSYIVNVQHITEYVKSNGGYMKISQHEISVSPDKLPNLLELVSNR
jgi:two-component system LytT family response regulator